MEKEKIVLGNGTELSYDSIGFQNGGLVISFVGGDITALEQAFRAAGQDNLEVIQQLDAENNQQAVHERYDLFKEIKKEIADAAENDVVKVVLEQEDEIKMEIRHLKSRTSAVEETTDTLVMEALA